MLCTTRFGSELLAAKVGPSCGDEPVLGRPTLVVISSRDGSLDRSSDDNLLNRSHAWVPLRPSRECTLLNPDPAVDGRNRGDAIGEAAVDGLDFSAWAS
jgi:hypothetical protein